MSYSLRLTPPTTEPQNVRKPTFRPQLVPKSPARYVRPSYKTPIHYSGFEESIRPIQRRKRHLLYHLGIAPPALVLLRASDEPPVSQLCRGCLRSQNAEEGS